jgi:hypothetical protein
LRGISELSEELLAVFPGEAECAYVGDADPSHDVANGRKHAVVWCSPSNALHLSSDPLKMMDNCFGELPEVVQMVSADLIDDSPVYRLVAVDRDISEANGFCQTFSQYRIDDLKFLENLEVLGHCGGRSCLSFGNQMRGDIDRKLDGALEIQRDDVLYVRLVNKLIHGGGSLAGNPLDATPERFQFSFD